MKDKDLKCVEATVLISFFATSRIETPELPKMDGFLERESPPLEYMNVVKTTHVWFFPT